MSYESTDRQSSAVACCELVEKIAERFAPSVSDRFSNLRRIAEAAIKRGALIVAPPQALTPENIIRRASYAKDKAQKEAVARERFAARLAAAGPPNPSSMHRAITEARNIARNRELRHGELADIARAHQLKYAPFFRRYKNLTRHTRNEAA